jgi:Domain of unknown function (DUF2383)
VTTPYTTIVPPPGTPLPDGFADALANLHTRTVDALAGYETMAAKAEPAFRPVAEGFRDIHARHAAALAGMLAQNGREADADGSFMSAVNRAVVTMRAFVDAIDADVLSAIRSGERHVLDAFDDAIAARREESDDHLVAMRDELQAAIDRTSNPE